MNPMVSFDIAPNADFGVRSTILSERDQCSVLARKGQTIAPNGLLAAIPSQEEDRSEVGRNQTGSLLPYFGMASYL